MSQKNYRILSTLSVFAARLYLIAFAIFSLLYSGPVVTTGAWLQLIFIGVLVAYRIKHEEQLVFIPDLFLCSLPYFWLLSLHSSACLWFETFKMPFIIAFALTIFHVQSVKTRFNISRNVLYGIWCSIVFLLLFATILKSAFPSFTHELYRVTLLNLIVFFGGLPICLTAGYRFLQPCSSSVR